MEKKHDIRVDRTRLHPWLDVKLAKLLKQCAGQGIYLIITEGFRTKEYQDQLYAQGRTKPGRVVTNARGSTYSSQHMWGIAFDIAINDKKLLYDAATIRKVAVLAKKLGLGWGGDWTSIVDTPHFYLKKWGSTTASLKRLYGTPDTFQKTWKKKAVKKNGLPLWKDTAKKKLSCRIPYGGTVEVCFVKSWFARVRYHGKMGYVNRKYLK